MRKKLNYFFAFFIIVFVFFAMLEILLRVFKLVPVHVVNESIYPKILGDYKPSQDFMSDFIFPYHVKINSLGLRGEEIDIEKPKGVYRILVLGDSYAFGERVNDDEAFAFKLEKILNDSLKDRMSIEVVNGGHAAYSTREEYEYLLERGVYLNPDMIILFWFPNDLIELSREYSWRDLLKEHYKFEPFKSYLRSFATFNALRQIISCNFIKLRFGPYVPKEEINIFDEEETPVEDKLWNRCFDYLVKIKNICDGKIKFILVGLADPEQFKIKNGLRPQHKLRVFAQSEGIDFINLAEVFASREKVVEDYYLMPKDPHFNKNGNKLVAKELCIYLKKYLRTKY
ncbi:MAG: SGNH/GDSL hydrolase family protein [Candidatus Omnitrophota bacterium]